MDIRPLLYCWLSRTKAEHEESCMGLDSRCAVLLISPFFITGIDRMIFQQQNRAIYFSGRQKQGSIFFWLRKTWGVLFGLDNPKSRGNYFFGLQRHEECCIWLDIPLQWKSCYWYPSFLLQEYKSGVDILKRNFLWAWLENRIRVKEQLLEKAWIRMPSYQWPWIQIFSK